MARLEGRSSEYEYKQSIEEQIEVYHFRETYIFDCAENRKDDISQIVEQATLLGYPVRYWWLSDAMDLQSSPDRLIVCVNHLSGDEDAGIDLFETLTRLKVSWSALEAAVPDEYNWFSKFTDTSEDICLPNGNSLFGSEA